MNQNWQRKKQQVDHSDDWLMTYADMITLLLCFFAIFLSVSAPKKKSAQALGIPPALSQPVPAAKIKSDEIPIQTATEVAEPGPDAAADAVPPASGDKSYAALLEIVNRLKSQGPSSIQQQGDRITTLQMSSAAFFGSGSAGLSESGKSILEDVAENIKSDKFKDYQVTVEGHTDDGAIRTRQFPSNWELSTARAAAVVHFLLQQGVPAQKLRAAGYADTFPVAPNRDSNGNAIPENQARNRRVVIKLEKIDKTG